MDSFDQLKIDTPEQIALELPLAGIGSRFLAMAIDTLIQAALYLISELFFSWFWGRSLMAWYVPRSVGPAMGIFIVFAIYWGYFAIFEILWKGQTPGKRFTGIRVIKESGRPINAFEAVGRNLMRAVDGLPGIYGVGLVCMMCNRQSRRLGDFVAGTVVVHEKPTEEVRPSWSTATKSSSPTPGPGHATADELVLIETYLSRRLELRSGGASANRDSDCGQNQSKDRTRIAAPPARRRFSGRSGAQDPGQRAIPLESRTP